MQAVDRFKMVDGNVVPSAALDEKEQNIYRGCGWAIAAFDNRQRLAALFYLGESNPYLPDHPDLEIENGVATALAWDKAQAGWHGRKTLIVMCSGRELCEPYAVSRDQLSLIFAQITEDDS
jgi:hypothetical protein|tara:strand:+ start:2764 stop:3126 length:363 start_codon:yes stop_codon:yes gene_type:complete